jgi:methionyl-tRNA formyltransferase
MRQLKILFMGTPEFSVPMLDAIHKSDYDLVGVVTAVDKPAGRGRQLNESAVKKYAVKNEIPVLQPTNLKSEDFLSDLKTLNPNLIVVVAFRMLPQQVWSFPKYGTFNLHASLLPQYRGAAPINWAIINGENETGLTTFFIDEKIDTGEIIDQVRLEIEKTDNVEDMYHKMLPKGSELVMNTINNIAEGHTSTIIQEDSKLLKPAPKLNKENTRIDWGDTLENIYNLVRGLSPFPLAWTILINGDDKIQCKIAKVNYHYVEHHKLIGELMVKDKSLFVAVKDGFIEILQIKLAGKRLLQTKDLLNGYEIKKHSKLQ